jgi:hypothetical protein
MNAGLDSFAPRRRGGGSPTDALFAAALAELIQASSLQTIALPPSSSARATRLVA